MSLFTTGTELKRFRKGALPKIALGVLLVIPLIYGALYLWAFWAPTDHMNRLPVAVVNADQPAEQEDGSTLAAGDDVVDRLLDGGELKWEQMTSAEASEAVADGDVYFSVTIPEDFSQTLAGLQEDPETGRIEVVYNDSNSFLASTLGKQAMVQLRDAVAETTTRTTAERVLVGVEKLSDGTRDAADAADRLETGTGALADASGKLSIGLGELADGTAQLVGKAPELTSGTRQLADGLGVARDGSGALAEGSAGLAVGAGEAATKSGELRDGLELLNAGAGELSEKLSGAADGAAVLAGAASELATGTADLSTGADAMQTGLAQLATGADDVNTGAAALSTGAAQLRDGTGQVATGVAAVAQLATEHPELTLAELDAQLQAQGTSLAQLSAGATLASDGAGTLADSAAALATGTQTLADSASTASVNAVTLAEGAQKAADGAQQLSDGATALNDGATQLSAGASTLKSSTAAAAEGGGKLAEGVTALSGGAQSVADGSAGLAAGVGTAADGADRLAAGADSLAEGATALDDGAQQAKDGASQLEEGASKVHEGADAFAGRLADGADEAPEFEPGQTARIADTMAAPVALDETVENPVQGFGGGFAPFFIALATFVGALISWLILRPLPRRPLGSNVSGLRTVLTGFAPAAVIGVGQVLVMMLVLVLGIGLRPVHWIGMSLFMLLTTFSFLALQQMFIVVLGTAPGRVVSLVLLMLQLSSSGGTYPVETTPGFFQALHPFMPASYVVDGLRQLVGGGIDGRLWIAVAVMVGVLLVSLGISAVAARRQKVWTLSRLHPSLAI